MPATATDFENLFVCNFFELLTNFKIHTTAAIIWRTKWPPRRRPNASYRYRFWDLNNFCSFSKECKFQKTQDGGHAATQIACVPEAANIQIPIRILKIEKNGTFRKKLQHSENTRHGGRGLPNRLRPGVGQNRSFLVISNFFFTFWRPTCRAWHLHLRRLRTPQPSPEGLSEVRRPYHPQNINSSLNRSFFTSVQIQICF